MVSKSLPVSKHVEDRTKRSPFEELIRMKFPYDLSEEEKELKKKKKISEEDLLAIREIKKMRFRKLSRAPDKNYPAGWEIEENP